MTRISRGTRSKAGDPKRSYSHMSAGELEKIAEPFEKEFVRTRPLTATMRAEERRAKRKRGRPVVGEGAEKVLITLERSLLREADSYAKKHKKNRSQLVAEGLRAVLGGGPVRRAS
jgi:hypothetical protein